MLKFSFILFSLLFIARPIFAQSAIDELEAVPEINLFANQIKDFPNEKIIRIGPTKKVFLITNENQGFAAGDYLTFLGKDKCLARAICAKVDNNIAGIKIIQIHDAGEWEKASVGQEYKILRGDDALCGKNFQTETGKGIKITGEEDLYNETALLDEDITTLDENKNRIIKTDNIVGAQIGYISGVDESKNAVTYQHWQGFWSYQIADNIWIEGIYGYNLIPQFPAGDIDTKLTSLTFRAKFTINAPFDSYIQPYIGYQNISASSDGAGQDNGENTAEERQDEIDLVNLNNKKGSIAGVTIYKRMVPGWFVKADLGTDIINLGLSFEF